LSAQPIPSGAGRIIDGVALRSRPSDAAARERRVGGAPGQFPFDL